MRCSELLSIISTMSHNENDILGILSFTLDNLNMLMYCDFLMAPLAAIRKILMLKENDCVYKVTVSPTCFGSVK